MNTHFYVSKPDSSGLPAILDVIEAKELSFADFKLHDWKRTDTFVKEHLKIVNPPNFQYEYIKKENWIVCSGPCRQLSAADYQLLLIQLGFKD